MRGGLSGFAPPLRLLPFTTAVLAIVLVERSAALVRASAEPGPGGPSATLASAGQAVLPSAQAAAERSATSAAVPSSALEAGVMPIGSSSPREAADDERSLISDLSHGREALSQKERSVAEREALLGAVELRLDARLGELQALQARLEALEAARQKREADNWRGLVKVYEAMKPRDAAVIMDGMDADVLLQVLDRMKETKAAPVLAAMDPAHARDATSKLAALRARTATLAPGT